MHGVQGFLNGAGAFARGLGVLGANPRLIPLLIVPVILNLVVYAGIVILGYHWFGEWLDSMNRDTWWWRWFLQYVWWLLYWVILFLGVFVTFVPIGSIVTAPFAEILSVKVEVALGPDAESGAGGIGGFVADIWLGVSQAIVRVVIFVLLLVVILPFFLIPIAGQALMIYVSSRYLAWDGLDYSLSRRRMRFSEKSEFLKTHRARTLGLGATAYALFLVPFTALFVLPLLAVSGTVLYCEIAAGEREAEFP